MGHGQVISVVTLLVAFLSFMLLLGPDAVAGQNVGQSLDVPHSRAREWDEILLDAIRKDSARPTVHARNLWHFSLTLWNCLVSYRGPTAMGWDWDERVSSWTEQPEDLEEALNETISYASFTLLKFRFKDSVGKDTTIPALTTAMQSFGLSTSLVDSGNEHPGELGIRIANSIITGFVDDGSNEENDYAETIGYTTINPDLEVSAFGSPNWESMDPNRYQKLFVELFIDQSGAELITFPDFLGPHWGLVTPFALTAAQSSCPGGSWSGDTCAAQVFFDPGAPPTIDSDEYALQFLGVSKLSSYNDPFAEDVPLWDISPNSLGNNTLGSNDGTGYIVNPVTGEPYDPQMVPRGDYTRVLAEFWADGPSSETPPGHWNTIINYVQDVRSFDAVPRQLGGQGREFSAVEWDIMSYFALNGALHDAAISAWSIKGHYDFIRPISAIRYMCEAGQRSDPTLPRYHPEGVILDPEYVYINIPQWDNYRNTIPLNAIMVYSWLGHREGELPAGSAWMQCGNWVTYQSNNFVTPPFAGYVSGHSTFSRAAAETVTALTGSPYFPRGLGEFFMPRFEVLEFEQGPSVDLTLQWVSYYDAADECGLSRIYGGIHPSVDDLPGRIIGRDVGLLAFTKSQTFFSTLPVVVDCEASEWVDQSECSKECFGGNRTQTRTITIEASGGGNQNCPTERVIECNSDIDCECEYSEWTDWEACDAPCGPGSTTRTREVTQESTGASPPCESLEMDTCEIAPCAVDCEVSEFNEWSFCNATCGSGHQHRNRTVVVEAVDDGHCDFPLEEVRVCESGVDCALDCILSRWGPWSACPLSCDNSTRYRSRVIARKAVAEGAECQGELSQSEDSCRVYPCSVGSTATPALFMSVVVAISCCLRLCLF